MRINNNMAAMNAWRSMTTNSTNMTKSLEKLSSGFRINKAGDDAAGLAVSEKMRAQIRGTNMAIRNAQDGVSLVQTAEGAAGKIGDMIQRMRELAVQSANGTYESADNTVINTEFNALKAEISRTAAAAKFNGIAVGTAGTVAVQAGADNGQEISVALHALDVTASVTGVATAANAKTSIGELDTALAAINTARASFGASQNTLESAISFLQTQAENLTAAESRIRDVDMAAEMAQFTKHNILQQASTAMLAQANQSTQGVLSLLR